MPNMFPHNRTAYEAVMTHFGCGHKRAAVVHATGTGKSYIIGAVASHYNKCLVIAPNNFVLGETRKVCHDGVEFRTYASVMYDQEPEAYDLIVLDEFHRSGAEKWGAGVQRLLDANADAFVLGTSATHIRYLDNQRNMADEIFDGNIVSSLSLKEAIDRSILPNPTYVSSIYTMEDTVRSFEQRIRACKRKDVDKEGICRRLHGIASNWDNAGGVPTIIRKYFSHDMQRVIVFCSKVKRAAAARELLSKWFGLAGFNRVRYYNIDYTEKRLEKEMADFQAPMGDYDLKVAISVNMLNEGVHIPRVDGVVMLRSTISRIIIEQQVGRCLTSDNKGRIPVVLDLVNNMDLISYDENPFFGVDKQGDGSRSGSEYTNHGFPFKVIDECRDMRVLLAQLEKEFVSSSHTKDECTESAKQYSTRTEWKKNASVLYTCARTHGWLEECCAHMKRLLQPHTKDECTESAKQYSTRKEWRKNAYALYSFAHKHGWLEECCAHMKRLLQPHTKEECAESAKQYSTCKEWKKNAYALYSFARKHGWLEECCAHMKRPCQPHTKEKCTESAKHYSTRKEWQTNASALYKYAWRHGWLDECCAHMTTKNKATK